MMTERLLERLFMRMSLLVIQSGKQKFRLKQRTLSEVIFLYFKFLLLELLIKNRLERISLQNVLEHPWIAQANTKITELRRKSIDQGDRLMQFLAYTNTDVTGVR